VPDQAPEDAPEEPRDELPDEPVDEPPEESSDDPPEESSDDPPEESSDDPPGRVVEVVVGGSAPDTMGVVTVVVGTGAVSSVGGSDSVSVPTGSEPPLLATPVACAPGPGPVDCSGPATVTVEGSVWGSPVDSLTTGRDGAITRSPAGVVVEVGAGPA